MIPPERASIFSQGSLNRSSIMSQNAQVRGSINAKEERTIEKNGTQGVMSLRRSLIDEINEAGGRKSKVR
jgi:hypothetical protein